MYTALAVLLLDCFDPSVKILRIQNNCQYILLLKTLFLTENMFCLPNRSKLTEITGIFHGGIGIVCVCKL